MIRVYKDFDNPPVGLLSESCRKHLLRFLKNEIPEHTYRYVTQDVYEKAAMNLKSDKSYSRVANALFEDFETFVVVRFVEGQQPYICNSFRLYQQGKLWPTPAKQNS